MLQITNQKPSLAPISKNPYEIVKKPEHTSSIRALYRNWRCQFANNLRETQARLDQGGQKQTFIVWDAGVSLEGHFFIFQSNRKSLLYNVLEVAQELR
jgi:hypothetical protein